MSLRIKLSEFDITQLDGGGIPILEYQGILFTGTVFENENDGTLSWEKEYKDGFQEGWCRSYHKNGKVKEQYKSHNNNVISGTHKEWNESGNLIWQSEN